MFKGFAGLVPMQHISRDQGATKVIGTFSLIPEYVNNLLN